MRIVPNNRSKNLLIESLRIFLALSICLIHTISFNYDTTEDTNVNYYLFVDFFFVISGFVLFNLYQRKLFEKKSTPKIKLKFILERLERMWPIALQAILLSTLLFLIEIYRRDTQEITMNVLPDRPLSAYLYAIFLLPFFSMQAYFIAPQLWSIPAELAINFYYLFHNLVKSNKRLLWGILLGTLLIIINKKFELYFHIPGIPDNGLSAVSGLSPIGRALICFTLGFLFRKNQALIQAKIHFKYLPIILLPVIMGTFYIHVLPYNLDTLIASTLFAFLLTQIDRYNIEEGTFSARAADFFGSLTYPFFALNAVVIDTLNYLYRDPIPLGAKYESSLFFLTWHSLLIIVVTLPLALFFENFNRRFISRKPMLKIKTLLTKNN